MTILNTQSLVNDIDSVERKGLSDIKAFAKEPLGAAEQVLAQATYDYDFVAPVAMPAGFPWHALPKTEWIVLLGIQAAKVLLNSKVVSGQAQEELSKLAAEHPLAGVFIRGLETSEAEVEAQLRKKATVLSREQQAKWFENILNVLREYVAAPAMVSGLDDYRGLFKVIPLPAIANTFEDDATFAAMRVAGPNPTSLTRVGEAGVPPKFPVSNEQYQLAMGKDETLTEAVSAGRVYMLDYAGLIPTVNGTYPSYQKYGFEPMALFAVPKTGADRELKAVAIQCGQDPQVHGVVDPTCGPRWLEAKTIVQVADGNFHELVAHLGRTHLLLAPFPVATTRWLKVGHPLRTLLEPHFEGMEFINWSAGALLVAPRNYVDQLLSGTIDADRTTAVRVTASRDFNASFLPTWLAQQGIADTDKLPCFPFRDDGLLLWNAIGEWAQSYVSIYWKDDASVQGDDQLQAWAQGLSAFDGGRIAGLGDDSDGVIRTADYLAAAIQMIIWTASAMHAAVNFPQGDLMTYAPAMPLAAYSPGPGAAGPKDEHPWLQLLPPLPQAHAQLNLLFLLGSVHYTKLGDYGDDYFSDPRVAASLGCFQQKLVEITRTIEARNLHRSPYEYLLPKNIPQSINI